MVSDAHKEKLRELIKSHARAQRELGHAQGRAAAFRDDISNRGKINNSDESRLRELERTRDNAQVTVEEFHKMLEFFIDWAL